jgi:hypothetical protein
VGTFIPAASTVRVRQLFLLPDGKTVGCHFYLSYSGTAPTAAELTAVAGACTTSADGVLPAYMSSALTLAGTTCTDLSSDMSAEGSVGDTTAGSIDTAPVPVDACVVLSYEIGRRYRGGHPRVYLPLGVAASLLNDYTWQSAFVADVVDAWTSLVEDTSVAFPGHAGTITQTAPSFVSGYTWETYGTPLKYRRIPTPRATAEILPVITTLGRSYVGSQRRRRPKISD